MHLFQGCANRDPALALAPLNLVPPILGDNACTSLHEKGLLAADTVADQAVEAQQILNDYGLLEEQNPLGPSYYWAFVPQAVALTYASTYSRSPVTRNLCGYSFGATLGNALTPDLDEPDTGLPQPLAPAAEAALFGTANGIPPTSGVNLINNRSPGGPREDRVSTSPSTGGQDQNLDGALCLRSLVLGEDPASGEQLRGWPRLTHWKLWRSVRRILAKGDLHGLPAVVVTGRADALLPPNHTSRAYFGLNQSVEGADSGLHYYEVTNAHHLDAFNAFPGLDAAYVPLHHYFIQGLDLLHDHLKNGTPLPPSQLVRTTPRGIGPDGVPPIEPDNLPPIQPAPETDLITFSDGILRLPG